MSRWSLAAGVFVAAVFLAPARSVRAQSFPVTRGSMELMVGAAALSLPEDYTPMIGVRPEVRFGLFAAEGLQIQAIVGARAWPLGAEAPRSYGLDANVLWFPRLAARKRDLYLMAGAGISHFREPVGYGEDSGIESRVQVGVGIKVPAAAFGPSWFSNLHFTVEFRGELLLMQESISEVFGLANTDFSSGLAIGFSRFF